MCSVAQGDLAGALTAYRDGLEIAARLAASDPGNAGWQRDLSVSHIKIGDVRVAQGDLAGALIAYQDSLDIAARLAASDPGNAVWQGDLAVSHFKIGNVRVAQGDLAGALIGLSGRPGCHGAAGGKRSRQCRLAARPVGQP